MLPSGKEKRYHLMNAIRKDDSQALLEYVTSNNIDVNVPLRKWTLLHFAAINDRVQCCEVLVKKCKADISVKDDNGNTALQLAVAKKSAKVVHLFVAKLKHDISNLEEAKVKNVLKKKYPTAVINNEFYMLLEDCWSKKSLASIRSSSVNKGSLLQWTVTNQWIVSKSNHAIPLFVDCNNEQVKCVPSTFVSYLFAVEDLSSRYNLFTQKLNLLHKNILLSINHEVEVRLEQEAVPATGVIRYKGTLKEQLGTYFGIEILDADKMGNTDGKFKGEQKFTCPSNKGIFVAIDKIEAKLSSSFLSEYAKQAACGEAPSRTFKITFVGPEGSGKTSSIRTLLGKKFNPNEPSTIGAVLNIQAIMKLFTGTTSTDEVNECDFTAFKLESLHTTGWKEASTVDIQRLLEKEYNKEMYSKLIFDHQPNIIDTEDFSSESSNTNNEEVKAVSDTEEMRWVTENNSKYKSAKDVVFGDKVEKLDNHASISDFAGQLTFFSFQLFFLKKRDVVVLTFNAFLELTAEVIPRERYDYAKNKRTAAGMMTTIHNLHFWLKSISAHAGTNNVPQHCISLRSPTAILCATHAEKLSKAQKDDIEKQIFESLKGKPYADHLPIDFKNAIVFISNKKRKKFKSNIAFLQGVLLKAAAPAYLEERPISYLKLEQLIAIEVKNGSNIISITAFTALVNKAGISGDKDSESVAAALQYCSDRGTLLHFSEVEILSTVVFISPQWLSEIFSKIITIHDQVTDNNASLYHAWQRYDKYAILEEKFFDHILRLASVLDHKEIIISLMQSFNLLAQIPTSTCFIGESIPPPRDGRVFIVPALLLHNPDLPVYQMEKEGQVYMFYFPDYYFPESVFNQLLVKMITWNVEKGFKIIRIQYGYGQFSLDEIQSYQLIYEGSKARFKVVITQLDTSLQISTQIKGLKAFLELMKHLETSIFSVMNLYIPSALKPVLHVFCPICDDDNPHIMLERVCNISLQRQLFCAKKGLNVLPRKSYLPFGDTLDYETFVKDDTNDESQLNTYHQITKSKSLSTLQEHYHVQGGFREYEALLAFRNELIHVLSTTNSFYHLVSAKIITTSEDEEMATSVDLKEKVSLVIKIIVKSLENGVTNRFYMLLTVMERCTSDVATVAENIRNFLAHDKCTDSVPSTTKNSPELSALNYFYKELHSALPIDDFLPELVTHQVITIKDKVLIAASGKTSNERAQYLLDHYIAKSLNNGDPSSFKKLLQLLSTSPICCNLAVMINQYITSQQNVLAPQAISHKASSVTANEDMRESVALVRFYKDLCNVLPVDDILPILITKRIITIQNKDFIMTGKTSDERTQYLLDHFISKSLSAGDTNVFYKLLEAMVTSPKCSFLVEKINQFLASTEEEGKLSGLHQTSSDLL